MTDESAQGTNAKRARQLAKSLWANHPLGEVYDFEAEEHALQCDYHQDQYPWECTCRK